MNSRFPPSFDFVSPEDELVHLSCLMHDATWESYELGPKALSFRFKLGFPRKKPGLPEHLEIKATEICSLVATAWEHSHDPPFGGRETSIAPEEGLARLIEAQYDSVGSASCARNANGMAVWITCDLITIWFNAKTVEWSVDGGPPVLPEDLEAIGVRQWELWQQKAPDA